MTIKVFIDGEAGTTGLQIRERLAAMREFSLVGLPAEARKDLGAKRELLRQVDFAILCLPDAAARDSAALVAELGSKAPRLIDASTAHRVAPGWVYGFPELVKGQSQAIAAAPRVANPGCYATGAIALLRPLVDAGALPEDFPVTINAVSGFTGGGKAMIEAYEMGEAPPFELYGLKLEHKHMAEIEAYSRLSTRPIFVPSVGNFRQGMLVSVPLHLDRLPGRPQAARLRDALARHYEKEIYVKVWPEAETAAIDRLEAESLNGTNDLHIFVLANAARRQAVLIAKLDNLGKGASGAAAQNLRLMAGL